MVKERELFFGRNFVRAAVAGCMLDGWMAGRLERPLSFVPIASVSSSWRMNILGATFRLLFRQGGQVGPLCIDGHLKEIADNILGSCFGMTVAQLITHTVLCVSAVPTV